MGREIRRVPANWEHPRNSDGEYRPLNDGIDYEDDANIWCEEFEKWKNKENRPQGYEREEFYFNYDEPPLREDYTDVEKSKCTWYQVYENISEGTPVTPPFETQDDLIDYLVEYGDFWCQRHKHDLKPSRESATNFVKGGGYAPSFIIKNGVIKDGINCC